MYELLRRWALAILKAPPKPQPPIGDPASLRVFNAGRNYFRLRVAGWAVAQVGALAALIFWTAFLISIEHSVRDQRAARANDPQAASSNQTLKSRVKETIRKTVDDPGDGRGAPKKARRNKDWNDFKQGAVELALLVPSGIFLLIWLVKIFSVLAYLVQLPLTYAVRRLDYEMRWYMVTDRSLRLRHGVWQISESTMSFANIQQVVVSQGPLQRLLGLADVKVKSAGGGGDSNPHQEGTDMHTGLFHSVTNAPEIRDLILERLRRFREAGLGDPDEKPSAEAAAPTAAATVSPDALAAARDLANEARALRAALATVGVSYKC